jgi:hypothetical protein
MTEETKVCKICKVDSNVSNFHIRPTNKNGLDTMCKGCRREQQKKYFVPALTSPEQKSKREAAWKKYHYNTTNQQRMLRAAKHRAKINGLEFDIDVSDIVIPEVCPILGIPLILNLREKRQDGSPSLDRIDSTKGYVKGNVFVISYRANTIKSYGTAAEHRKIADYIDRMTHLTTDEKV